MARAIADHASVTLATHLRNRPQLEREGCGNAKIEYIDNEYVARPMYNFGTWLRGGSELGWTTHIAACYPSYLAFEHEVWRRFGPALRAGGFDVVHRLTPMSPTLPSPLARTCPVPFVIGPLNGGLPWPAEYSEQRSQEKDWLVRLREAYRWLPFYRSTYERSAAILAAFRHTAEDLPESARGRIVSMPEVGIEPSLFRAPERRRTGSRLTLLFAGRLVPYKLPSVVVDSVAQSAVLREHRVLMVGDGPERPALEERIARENLSGTVQLLGRRPQAEVAELMRQSDIFVFPSIRELGAGVIAEAMASGLCSVGVDYGAPAELLDDGRGVKVPLGSPAALTSDFRAALERLVRTPERVREIGERARQYALSQLSWDVKARSVADLYDRVLDGRALQQAPVWPPTLQTRHAA
jgi:glycosyltransferase involved in cell wall biosynthesis